MPGLDLDLVTEVFIPSTKGFGSGYFLASGLVITAAHVIAPIDQPLPKAPKIEVRPIREDQSAGSRTAARLIWPPPERWLELARHDIALLQAEDRGATAGFGKVRLDWEGIDTLNTIPLRAVGFPRFRYTEKLRLNDTHVIVGNVSKGDRYKADVIEFEMQAKGLDAQRWKGMSGAALFADNTDNLVAIVTEATSEFFRAARLKAALRDKDFQNAIAPARLAGSSPAAPRARNIRSFIYLLDRSEQMVDWKPALERALSRGSDRGFLCCFITGESHHEPNEFTTRLRLQQIPDIMGKVGDDLVFRPLAWPLAWASPESGLARLKKLVWSIISEGQDFPSDDIQIVEQISLRDSPLFLQTELPPNLLDSEQHAELMRYWYQFWADLKKKKKLRQPILHLVVLRDRSKGDVEKWIGTQSDLWQAPCDLTPCFHGELEEWLRHLERSHLPSLKARRDDLLNELADKLEAEGGFFSIRQVKHALKELTQKGATFEELNNG